MQVTCIRYGRKLSDGDYGSEMLEIECAPGDESVEQALSALKQTVLGHLLDGKGTQPLEPVKTKSAGRAKKSAPLKVHEPPWELPEDFPEWNDEDWDDFLREEKFTPQQLLDVFQKARKDSIHYDDVPAWKDICEAFTDAMTMAAKKDPENAHRKEMMEDIAEYKKQHDRKRRK